MDHDFEDFEAHLDDIIRSDAQDALNILPSRGVSFACAYGSRYLERSFGSQLDLLIAVESDLLDEWHAENITRNPKHYFLSSIPSIAHGLATRLQRRPPGAFFHTFIDHPTYQLKELSGMPDEQKGRPYWKYGVIGVKDLVEDLTSWNHLFIAGRLQKPVLDLDTQGLAHISSVISDARRQNLRAAAAAAMVILPQDFSELDLYYTICSLSYAGDVRLMLGAENPQKLQSMIYKRPHALQRFRTLFEPILESAQDRGILIRSRKPSNSNVEVKAPVYKYEQDISRKPELIRTYLPERVQDHVFRNANHLDDFSDNMKDYVIRTVRKSSAKQLLNNVLMNNPLKSSKYAFAKLAKGLRR